MTPADAKALAEAVKVLVTEVVDANKLTAAITVAGNEKYSEYADALQSLLDHAQTWLPRMQQIAAEDAAARSQVRSDCHARTTQPQALCGRRSACDRRRGAQPEALCM